MLHFIHKFFVKNTATIYQPIQVDSTPIGYNRRRINTLNNARTKKQDLSNGLYVPKFNPTGGMRQQAGVYGTRWRNDETIVHLSNKQLLNRQNYKPPMYTPEKLTNMRKIASFIHQLQG